MPCGLAAWLPGCLVPGWVRCRAGLQRTPLSWPSLPWPSLAYLGLPWPTLACLGLPCSSLACLGLPWPALVCLGLSWSALACLGLPWSTLAWPGLGCSAGAATQAGHDGNGSSPPPRQGSLRRLLRATPVCIDCIQYAIYSIQYTACSRQHRVDIR